MIDELLESGLMIFVVFCRVGSSLMLIPGFSSSRVPVRFRLYIALGISAGVAPLISGSGITSSIDFGFSLLRIVVFEIIFGIVLGLLCRFMFNALEVLAEVIAMSIGLTNNLGAPIDGTDIMPVLASFISLVASLLIVVLDLHWEVLRGLINSYEVVPLGSPFEARKSLIELVDVASFAFLAAVKIAGPFLVFALIVNFAFGLVNKMIPQVPIYFISLPFVLSGGLWLMYALAKSAFQVFVVMFSLWLANF